MASRAPAACEGSASAVSSPGSGTSASKASSSSARPQSPRRSKGGRSPRPGSTPPAAAGKGQDGRESAPAAARTGQDDLEHRAETLRNAARYGSLEVIAELCGSADVSRFIDEVKGEEQTTALMEAVMAGRGEAVKALLDAGADANLRDSEGRTALMLAAEGLHAQMFVPLLDHGGDASLKAHNGRTCLLFACAADEAALARADGTRVSLEDVVEKLIDQSEARGKVRDDMELQAALGVARAKQRAGVKQLLADMLEDETGLFTPR
jgi:hypothetical protein